MSQKRINNGETANFDFALSPKERKVFVREFKKQSANDKTLNTKSDIEKCTLAAFIDMMEENLKDPLLSGGEATCVHRGDKMEAKKIDVGEEGDECEVVEKEEVENREECVLVKDKTKSERFWRMVEKGLMEVVIAGDMPQ